MKTFMQFIEEDIPGNSASAGAVAAIGVGPSGEPPKAKAKKRLQNNGTLMFKRKLPEIATS